MEIIITILAIVACVLLFSLAVFIHEFGHFIAARKLGLRVEAFSIGFGPAIWKKKVNGVEYRISIIPFGGYVSLPDLDPEGTKALEGETQETDEQLADELPPWKKIIVAFAGPFGNIVLAIAIALLLANLIRDALLPNLNILYCDNITLADGTVAGTPTAPNAMEASATVMSLLTPKMVSKAVTKMKKDRVPTINGKYYAVIHPSVAHDLRNDKEWIEVHKYSATGEIFNGEIGELHNCRFIENVFAPVLGGDYKNKAGTMTYATYFFGKEAFGIIDPEGGALQMIVKSKEQAGGPLNQFSTVGYKFETNGATILYPERVLRVMSCSSYSAIDEAN